MDNGDIHPVIVEAFLEREGVHLPAAIMKHKVIIEIEKELRKNVAVGYSLSTLFKEYYYNLDEFIDEKSIEELVKFVSSLKKNKHYHLSEDDKKLIECLIELETKNSESAKFNPIWIKSIGPLYFLFKILEKISDDLPKILRAFIIINVYLMLYELLLGNIDNILYICLKNKNKHNEVEKKFLNVKRDEGDHATPGRIIPILSKLCDFDIKKSIFSKDDSTRILRNKIAHVNNIFYDEDSNIFHIGNEFYTVDDIVSVLYKLLSFIVTWVEIDIGTKIDDEINFKKNLIIMLSKILFNLSQDFLKVQRSGTSRFRLTNLIISIKKEKGLFGDTDDKTTKHS